ncbi:MAG: RNA polymerase sigma factor [Phycisphaerales bacterium]|jgi:RNA polymerase sigma-70 factor (ECF subfamily)
MKTGNLQLIKQAQSGERGSMDQLASLAKDRLSVYLYRITLDVDLTQDMLQETLLQLVQSIRNLQINDEKAFWAWLYRTAQGKVQHHFRLQGTRRIMKKTVTNTEGLENYEYDGHTSGLDNIARKEMVGFVMGAMKKLSLRYRSILTLRCLEGRSYHEIATVMNCSRLKAQSVFFQAKHTLRKQLSRQGIQRSHFLPALGIFATVTAGRMKVASAAVTASAASAQVGLLGTLIGILSLHLGKIIIVTMTGAALVTVTNINANDGLASPASIVSSYDPDGNGFQGYYTIHNHDPHPIDINACLVNRPASNNRVVVIPENHWIEVAFAKPIVDGPGDDVVIREQCAHGEQADVFITDSEGQMVLLGKAVISNSMRHLQSPTVIGFDIAEVRLPFIPKGVRIVCTESGGKELRASQPGFDLISIRARIKDKTSD